MICYFCGKIIEKQKDLAEERIIYHETVLKDWEGNHTRYMCEKIYICKNCWKGEDCARQ
jgi:hypothetical protein